MHGCSRRVYQYMNAQTAKVKIHRSRTGAHAIAMDTITFAVVTTADQRPTYVFRVWYLFFTTTMWYTDALRINTTTKQTI